MANDEGVPAGYRLVKTVHGTWDAWGDCYTQSYATRDEAIAAIREHQARVAEGSPLVAELRRARDFAVCQAQKFQDERDALRAEVERLRGQVYRVLVLAEAYMDLTTYPLGQECCVGKLRDIWRARRAREEGDDGEA